MRIARFGPLRPTSTTEIARWHSVWRSGRCSVPERSTMRSRHSGAGPCGVSTPRCGLRSGSAHTSSGSSTVSHAMRPSTSRSSSSVALVSNVPSHSRTRYCAASATASGRSSRRYRRRRRPRPGSSTRTRTGSPRRGGATSARRMRSLSWSRSTSRGSPWSRLVRGEIVGTPARGRSWRVGCRSDRRERSCGRTDLATERRVTAGRIGRRRDRARTHAGPLRGTRWQGDHARRRGHGRRDQRGTST